MSRSDEGADAQVGGPLSARMGATSGAQVGAKLLIGTTVVV